MTKYLKLLSKYHFHIYYGSLIILALAHSFSRFMISVSMFALAINWLLEGHFKAKWNTLKKDKSILVFCSFFLMLLIALLYNDHFNDGIIALRKKIPMLILPIVIGTSIKLTYKQLKILLMVFILGVFAHTLMSTALFAGFINLHNPKDPHNIAFFYSHIRFALMIVFSIFCLGYFIFCDNYQLIRHEKLISSIFLSWLIIFLFILNALTGILIFLFLVMATGLHILFKTPGILKKIIAVGSILTIITISTVYTLNIYNLYHSAENINKDTLPEKTANGNKYKHKINSDARENGHYVWLYYCPKELSKAWNKQSNIPYDSLDHKKQPVKHTLVRYMTSKGLTKDSAGIAKLTAEDIKAIESGLTNYKFRTNIGLFTKIYELVWEFDHYKKSGMPKGTMTRRLVSYQTAGQLIKENFLLGVGTGDMRNAYHEHYKKQKPGILKNEKWIHGHNQFLSIFVSYGILGFIWFCVALFYPVYVHQGYKNYFFAIFFAISLLSMFTEDTLNIQIGVSFFVFFYTLLLFGQKVTRS